MKMRRSTLTALVLTLPSMTAAVSLSVFQEIPTESIPAVCARAYTSEIAVCTADDFNIGCTSRCRRALEEKAREVTTACSGLIVNSKSLLGIVQSGGVVSRLCLRIIDDATTTSARSFISLITSRPQPTTTSTRQAPPPIVVAPSTTQPSNTITSSTRSLASPSPSSTTLSDVLVVQPTTLSPDDGIIGDIPTETRSRSTALPTTTRAPAVVPVNNANEKGPNGSGGGSPFDVTSAAASNSQGVLLSMFAVMGWAFVLLG